MLNLGYVKVKTGVSKNRIGRYVRDDLESKKCIVSFNYQIDIIPYCNYTKFTKSTLTNEIEKEDLINRYYEIILDLKDIDLGIHRKIKKYSKEHQDLITETDLIRHLFNNYNNINELNRINKEDNIIIFSSFKDLVWVNDFILDLEDKKLNIGNIDHETYNYNLNNILDISNNFIFILSTNSINNKWFKEEYLNIYSSLTKEQKVIAILIDDSKTPTYLDKIFNLGEHYTDNYNDTFSLMINYLENIE